MPSGVGKVGLATYVAEMPYPWSVPLGTCDAVTEQAQKVRSMWSFAKRQILLYDADVVLWERSSDDNGKDSNSADESLCLVADRMRMTASAVPPPVRTA